MRAYATIRGPDGQTRQLGPGDLIGRVWCATLHVDDPMISEAHAMVSLRGGSLRLLALRGRFAVNGELVTDTELLPGLRVVLAPPDVGLDVLDVVLPDEAVALVGDRLASTILHGPIAIALRPDPAVVAPTSGDAAAWVWPSHDRWRLRGADGATRDLPIGEAFTVGAHTLRLQPVPLQPLAPTREGLAVRDPLRIVARYETVHLHRPGAVPVVLDGVPARLVSELVAMGAPVAWTVLCGELWPGTDTAVARKRLDATLSRLRSALQAGDVRGDLVRSTGRGQYELLLEPGDTIEDQL